MSGNRAHVAMSAMTALGQEPVRAPAQQVASRPTPELLARCCWPPAGRPAFPPGPGA